MLKVRSCMAIFANKPPCLLVRQHEVERQGSIEIFCFLVSVAFQQLKAVRQDDHIVGQDSRTTVLLKRRSFYDGEGSIVAQA